MKKVERSMEESKMKQDLRSQSLDNSTADPGYGHLTRAHDPELNLALRTGNTPIKQGSTDSGLYSIPSEYRLRHENGNSDSDPAASITGTPLRCQTPRTPTSFLTPGVKLSPFDIEYEYARPASVSNDLEAAPQAAPEKLNISAVSGASLTGVPHLGTMAGMGGALGGGGLGGSSQLDAMMGSRNISQQSIVGSGMRIPSEADLTGAGVRSQEDPYYHSTPVQAPGVRIPISRRSPPGSEDVYAIPHRDRLTQPDISSASPARYNRPMYAPSSGLTSRTSSVDDLDYRSLSYASRSLASSDDSFNTTRSAFSQTEV